MWAIIVTNLCLYVKSPHLPLRKQHLLRSFKKEPKLFLLATLVIISAIQYLSGYLSRRISLMAVWLSGDSPDWSEFHTHSVRLLHPVILAAPRPLVYSPGIDPTVTPRTISFSIRNFCWHKASTPQSPPTLLCYCLDWRIPLKLLLVSRSVPRFPASLRTHTPHCTAPA